MTTVSVRYFARCRELCGTDAEDVPVSEGDRVADVIERLAERHPSLRPYLRSIRYAKNREFVDTDTPVGQGDELALIPPVSGGSGAEPDIRPRRFALSTEPIAHDAAVWRLGDSPQDRGALATFAGTVRRNSQGKRVVHLDYEAYEPMAVEKLESIEAEIREKWPILDLAVVHRIGRLEVGDVAVSIAVSAAHRAEALEACRYCIDRLKDVVPIWKKETAEDGETWWGRGA